jgi:hypothetical protein
MRNRISAVLFVAALAIVSVEARAALIVNGDFDTNPVTGGFAIVTPSSAFQITGWRVLTSGGNTNASVDLVKAPYWRAHSGANSVDLFGTGEDEAPTASRTVVPPPRRPSMAPVAASPFASTADLPAGPPGTGRTPAELAVMRALKAALDPAGILTPGALLPPLLAS